MSAGWAGPLPERAVLHKRGVGLGEGPAPSTSAVPASPRLSGAGAAVSSTARAAVDPPGSPAAAPRTIASAPRPVPSHPLDLAAGREPPYNPFPSGGPGCWRSTYTALLVLLAAVAALVLAVS